ncbi:hypothetical protein TELCIR_22468, partial [Teladorsagia circumcincta]
SYDLSVKPYLPAYAGVPTERQMTFDGEVEIKAETYGPGSVDKIELNMLDLKILEENCSVTVNNKAVKIRNISVNKEYQKVVFNLHKSIEPDEEIKIKVSLMRIPEYTKTRL